MEANKIPTEFITYSTLTTLGGSAFVVWMAGGVIQNVFDFNPRWLAVAIAILVSVLISLKKKKKKIPDYALAVVNGMLIYFTAIGFNSFTTSSLTDTSSKNKVQDTLKKSGMIENIIYESSLFPFD